MTDNGSASGHTRYDDFAPYNAGMRGFKGNIYDGGHRVPCFIRWPGGGVGGDPESAREIDRLTAHLDMMPTLLDLCGIEAEEEVERGYDGVTLAPALRGEAPAPIGRSIFVQSQRIETPAHGRRYAVLTEDYRLVNGRELYGISNDPGQKDAEDITGFQSNFSDFLQGTYDRWWEDLNADLPDVAYILGDDAANPTSFTSHDLHHDDPGHDGAPWHQVHVERNNPNPGFYLVDIAQPGRYRFTLRRYPEAHGGPTGAVSASVTVGEQRSAVDCDPEAGSAVIEMSLPTAGRTRLRTALIHEDGAEHVAFFVEVERLGDD